MIGVVASVADDDGRRGRLRSCRRRGMETGRCRIFSLERTLILSHFLVGDRRLDTCPMAEGTILMPVPSSGSAPSLKLKPVTPVKDTSKRRVTVLSFWAIALLGVPYWWKTTTVERLQLPSTEIQGWRERAVSTSKEERFAFFSDDDLTCSSRVT